MLRLNDDGTGGCREKIVHELAERCAAATLSRLSTAANTMTAPELRGYVRAHAWPWIAAEVQRLQSAGRIASIQQSDLIARALEQTVHLVTRACASAPVVAMPMPHIARRAAA